MVRKKVLDFQYISWIMGLSLGAGFLNATAILVLGQTVSHVTGNIVNSSLTALTGDWGHFWALFMSIVAFLLGTIVSGVIFTGQGFQAKRRYGWVSVIFGVLLVAMRLGHLPLTTLIEWLAFGLGVQNGMFVYYRGMIVRTTHMTGNLTDLGLALGRFIRKERHTIWKARFQVANIGSYLAGAVMAGLVREQSQWDLILVGGCLQLIIGGWYFVLHNFVTMWEPRLSADRLPIYRARE